MPGVGEKTARKLVNTYPTLDALMDDADSLPKRLSEQVSNAREYVAAMQGVVPVRPDVTVEIKQGPRDDAGLAVLGETRRLGGPIRRLTEALAALR